MNLLTSIMAHERLRRSSEVMAPASVSYGRIERAAWSAPAISFSAFKWSQVLVQPVSTICMDLGIVGADAMGVCRHVSIANSAILDFLAYVSSICVFVMKRLAWCEKFEELGSAELYIQYTPSGV